MQKEILDTRQNLCMLDFKEDTNTPDFRENQSPKYAGFDRNSVKCDDALHYRLVFELQMTTGMAYSVKPQIRFKILKDLLA